MRHGIVSFCFTADCSELTDQNTINIPVLLWPDIVIYKTRIDGKLLSVGLLKALLNLIYGKVYHAGDCFSSQLHFALN